MRFLKNESKRTRNKLTINTNKKIENYSKFTKFGKLKYSESLVENRTESAKESVDSETEDLEKVKIMIII